MKKEITLKIVQSEVYLEVQKSLEYIAAKKGTEFYEQISVVDENTEMLERFWSESKNLAVDIMREFRVEPTKEDDSDKLEIVLGMPASFDSALKDNMQSSLFSFFVANIISNWLTIVAKDDAEIYLSQAKANIELVQHMLYSRKRPTRPT